MLHGHPLALAILVADSILGCIPGFLVLFLLDMVIQLISVLDLSVLALQCWRPLKLD